jgi:hypothetical protein
MIDLKIVGAILLGVIGGVAGYLIGKSRCGKRHPYGPPGEGRGGMHPHQMFAKHHRGGEQ